jgi:anti-sigma factor RsiW
VSRGQAIACTECRELLGGYVLDALDPGESEAVRAHIASCPECAREHSLLAPVPSLLDVAGSADAATPEPPAALEEVVLDRFARERPRPEPAGGSAAPAPAGRGPLRRWLARPLPVAAAAAAAAVLVTLAVSGALDDSDDYAHHAYGASLRGSPAAPGAHAYAKLTTQATGTRVDLHVRGMQPTPGTVYELWCVGRDDTRVSAGTFRVDGAGRASVRLATAARLGEYDRLTVERLATAGAQGERVMAGAIEY